MSSHITPSYDWFETQTEVHLIFYSQNTKSTIFNYNIENNIFNSTLLTFTLPHNIKSHSMIIHKNSIEITFIKEIKCKWDSLVVPKKIIEQRFDIEDVSDEFVEELNKDMDIGKWLCDIYSNGDEDQKRAMNKSILESQGTVLSSKWEEVGKKKVDKVESYVEPDDQTIKRLGL